MANNKGANASKTVVKKFDDVKSIQPGTPEMEQYLQAGYGGMTVEQAKHIIKTRNENPFYYPFEMEVKAKAFLAAYEAVPVAVDTTPGWKRYPNLKSED